MSEVVNLIKASTIVVVRPDPNGGIEVLMTRRCPEMQFLGGFLVFPGGGVENEDCSEKMLCLCRGLTRSDAQKILGADLAPEVSLGHWVAAVRELFEETGIHFFIDENGMAPDGSTGHLAERLGEKRQALSSGTLDLPRLLEFGGSFAIWGALLISSTALHPKNTRSDSTPVFTWLRFLLIRLRLSPPRKCPRVFGSHPKSR